MYKKQVAQTQTHGRPSGLSSLTRLLRHVAEERQLIQDGSDHLKNAFRKQNTYKVNLIP